MLLELHKRQIDSTLLIRFAFKHQLLFGFVQSDNFQPSLSHPKCASFDLIFIMLSFLLPVLEA